MPAILAESTPLVEAAAGVPKSRKFRARLIAGDIQGSSGYYPAKTLRESAGVFHAGLPVYLDHPSATEAMDRPERSVRDLAGKLASNAVYDRDGLYADVEVYPHMAPVIEAMSDDIGMSIRAYGTVEASTQENIRGPIVTALTEASSVDFVTAAGAGGKVVALLESARKAEPDQFTAADRKAAEAAVQLSEARNVAQWIESRIHLMFTQIADDLYGDARLTRDERIALSSGIGDALDAFSARVQTEQPQLYQRDRWDGPPEDGADLSETDQAIPENPGDSAKVTETEPGTEPANKKESGMPEITEEQVKALAEAATVRAQLDAALARIAEGEKPKPVEEPKAVAEASPEILAKLAELEKGLTEANTRAARLETERVARAKVTEALRASDLPATAHGRVTEAVCRDLPFLEGGVLDVAGLVEATTKAIESEAAYIASFAEAAGAGKPRGLGGSGQPAEFDEAALDAQLESAFAEIGLTEADARTAARGR